MSSSHCQLVYEGTKLFVKDLESKNGTFVNGVRIETASLYFGDELRLGKTKITLVSEKSDQQSSVFQRIPRPKDTVKESPLKLDFTGVRQAKEFAHLSQAQKTSPTHSMSPQPIARVNPGRKQNQNSRKMLSSLASTIDLILCLLAISAPLLILNILLMLDIPYVQANRLTTLLLTEAGIVGFFLLTNFYLAKHSLGEKFVGLDRIRD